MARRRFHPAQHPRDQKGRFTDARGRRVTQQSVPDVAKKYAGVKATKSLSLLSLLVL